MRVKNGEGRERERERLREWETSDSAKVCGLTGVCSVAMSTAESRSEQQRLSRTKIVSVLKPKIVIKTNWTRSVDCLCEEQLAVK